MPTEEKEDIVQKQKRKRQVQRERRERVERLKKMIIIGMFIAILIPTVLCIILFVKLGKLEQDMELLQSKIEALDKKEVVVIEEKKSESAKEETTNLTEVESEEIESKEFENKELETMPVISENKINVYLTFDDGPSDNTNAILDILNQYQVKATFFVVGKSKTYDSVYKRIVEDGHSIGMHSYSHKYGEIYASIDSFCDDVEKLQELIFEKTGVMSKLYRFPGGSSNTVSQVEIEDLIACLEERGITYYDWNVSNLDATSEVLSVDDIVENVTGNIQKYNNAIVLMHDANDKVLTVEALPIIIERLQEMGNVEILPITEQTTMIQHTTLEKE